MSVKKNCIRIIVVLVFIGISVNIKPICEFAVENLITVIDIQFKKEEAERERRMVNGEIVRGKDTVLIWKNMYVIFHSNDGKCLCLETSDTKEELLANIQKHKVKKKKLFVISNDGYAVIDNQGSCRIYVTAPENELCCRKQDKHKIVHEAY